MQDRRQFLRSASVGALALAAGVPALAAAAGAGKPRVLVDWHAHFVTNAESDFLHSASPASC